jgi:hypothetical protein
MSETMSISASACAIFCSEEIWGRPPIPKKDMLMCMCVKFRFVWIWQGELVGPKGAVLSCVRGGDDVARAAVPREFGSLGQVEGRAV